MSIRRDGADGTRTDEAVSTVDMKDPVLFWEPDKIPAANGVISVISFERCVSGGIYFVKSLLRFTARPDKHRSRVIPLQKAQGGGSLKAKQLNMQPVLRASAARGRM
ncbi:uncharacterized [Tachysurus ichikawai]